jgi:hypothetical protein
VEVLVMAWARLTVGSVQPHDYKYKTYLLSKEIRGWKGS